MKKYTLPPRDWYTLEQAIKRIKTLTGEELEIDDLIHYWNRKKLEIAIFISVLPNEIHIGKSTIIKRDKVKQIYSFQAELLKTYGSREFLEIFESKISESEISEFQTKNKKIKTIEEKNDITLFDLDLLDGLDLDLLDSLDLDGLSLENKIMYLMKGKEYITENILINGFLSVIDLRIEYIKSQEDKGVFKTAEIILSSVKEQDQEKRFSLHLDFHQEILLRHEDFFILHSDLIDFLEGKAQPPKIEEINKPSPKTTNAQTKFIYDFLLVHYGEDFVKNIRQEIDNPNGEIRRDFDAKKELGVELPSGKTLQNWLKNI